MDFDKYQEMTEKTAIYKDEIENILNEHLIFHELKDKVTFLLQMSYAGLGLGESGETQNKLKKIIRDHKGEVNDEVRKGVAGELGGMLYYIAQMCTIFGLSMSDVAEDNIKILYDRLDRGVIKGSGDNR